MLGKIDFDIVRSSFLHVIMIIILVIIGGAFWLATEDKKQHEEYVAMTRTELAKIRTQIQELKYPNATYPDELTKMAQKEITYERFLAKRLKEYEDKSALVDDTFKVLVGCISIAAYLLASINYQMKYNSLLAFIITPTKSPNKNRQRLVITNQKDRTETILGVYLLGPNQERIELLDYTCEPKSLSSFGHVVIFFESNEELSDSNLCKHYKLVVCLGNGKMVKVKPLNKWKNAHKKLFLASEAN
ncbi:hypothetical protein [Vibrio sp. 1CM24A]|uniref:hypothetical protein n=1 Tax=Vibrio sp. 1CM24A TaxID=2929165 RepID=UPI0020BEAA5F|nr:hypothetical protein [Vibrio sp. 1CM24A]MCK8083752.1 hypothetical protein [Vibrio sp. 1CM24A]